MYLLISFDRRSNDHRRLFQDVRITHTVILDDPFDDPPGLEVPDRSPGPDASVLQSDRIAAFEKLDDTEGLTNEEVRI